MKILLTGGAGFIGSHLLDRLLPRGDEVVVVDDFNDYYDPEVKRENVAGKKVEIVEADVRDTTALEPLVARKPDAIVHLAARAGVRPSLEDPVLYSDVNVRGLLGLLELCRKHKVERFVFASSSSVYGNGPVPFSEDRDDLAPVSPYGATKLIGEHYLQIYSRLHGMKVTCLRFFTAYGPRQRPDMAIHKFARRIDRGEEIPLFGKGDTRRDYTYIDDIIQGVVRAIDTPEEFAVYNLGESRTVKLGELVALLESALGKKAKIRREPEQPGDVRETYADISRARDRLGYAPKVPIEEGLRRFVEWFTSRPRS